MMKFRRRTFRHRRPSRFQMLPLHLCAYPITVPIDSNGINCDNPVQTATELPNTAGGIPFANQAMSKGILVKGINFQYAYSTLGEEDLNAYGFFEVRTAIVRLPKDPLTGAPAFLPNLFSNAELLVTERVLWRGFDNLWMWSKLDAANSPQGDSRLGGGGFSSNLVPGNASAQANIRIKTACRIRENEALFFVQCWNSSFINWTFEFSAQLFGSVAVHTVPT